MNQSLFHYSSGIGQFWLLLLLQAKITRFRCCFRQRRTRKSRPGEASGSCCGLARPLEDSDNAGFFVFLFLGRGFDCKQQSEIPSELFMRAQQSTHPGLSAPERGEKHARREETRELVDFHPFVSNLLLYLFTHSSLAVRAIPCRVGPGTQCGTLFAPIAPVRTRRG